jgi:isopenicillin-N N-acyltransferase-like protein
MQTSANKPFPELEVSGTPFECGTQQGEQLRDDVHHVVKYTLSLLNKTTREAALRHAHKHLPFVEEYSPEVAAEMRGIAEGAGCAIDEILLVSLHEELSGFPSGSTSGRGCTTLAATGMATRAGESYLCQTWDIAPDLCRNARPHVIIAERANAPDTLSFVYPGMVAGAGLNLAGIGISWNSVPRLSIRPGVPTYVIIAEVLRQPSIGEALAAIFRAERAGCFNFMLADETEIYSIEATPDEVGILYSGRTLGHANHYVSEPLKGRQDLAKEGRRHAASSIVRHYRVNRLLEEADGRIDLEACQRILQDHVNYPQSICRHIVPELDQRKSSATCASWVILPGKKEWWVTRGTACDNPFVQYGFPSTAKAP